MFLSHAARLGPFLGNIHHREIVDIRTGQLVPNMVNGEKVPQPVRPLQAEEPVKPTAASTHFDPQAYLRANPMWRLRELMPESTG